MFLLDIGQRLRIYEAEYRVLEEADLISDDHKTLLNYITDLEKNYANVVSAHKEVVKQNKEMLEELKVTAVSNFDVTIFAIFPGLGRTCV